MSRRRARSPVPEPRRGDAAPGDDIAVVAVDGSEASIRALIWTLRHATEHGLRVEVLTTWPLHGPVFVREVSGHFSEPRWRAREAQAQAAARALAAVENAPAYDLRVENAELVDALARAARRSALIVVGSDTADEGTPDARRLTVRARRDVQGPLVVVGPEGPVGARGREKAGTVPEQPTEPRRSPAPPHPRRR